MNGNSLRLAFTFVLLLCVRGNPAMAASTELDNIARGTRYTFSKPPSYSLCTDEGDATDLTDGVRSGQGPESGFWTEKSTVGWAHPRGPVIITMDLGKVEPISGAAVCTASGGAGVSLPLSIVIEVSDDNQTFYTVGDMVHLGEERWPPAYGTYSPHVYRTTTLRTRGRYVRFVCLASNIFLFFDEIEVYRGEDIWPAEGLASPSGGEEEWLDRTRLTRIGCSRRIRQDLEQVEDEVARADLVPGAKEEADALLAGIREELGTLTWPADARDFKAILPLNPLHARVFAIYGRLLQANGLAPMTVWHTPRYRLLPLLAKPEGDLTSLQVSMMSGERRAEVINLTNASATPRTVQLQLKGLPARIQQVEYVDTREAKPVASALHPVNQQNGNWITTVPAGMTRQIWFSFEPADLEAGQHEGTIAITSGDFAQDVPIVLDISPIRFPASPRLTTAMWDYAVDAMYGVTDQNQAAVRDAVLGDSILNGMWAPANRLPWPPSADAEGNLTGDIDFTMWDEYVRYWPGKRLYAVFAAFNAQTRFLGLEPGTPPFDRAVSQWAAKWAAHNRELGLEPGQAAVLFIDEPTDAEWFEATYRWAKAFRDGSREITVFNDPSGHHLDQDFGAELVEASDIVCPTVSHFGLASPRIKEELRGLHKRGKDLWFYMCSGPVRQYDTSYYRLQPWHCFQNNAVGSGFWALGDNGNGDSWNEYWSVARTAYTPFFLGEKEIATSKHWEALREGVADYEYLAMLRDRVAALRARGVADPALQRAEAQVRDAAPALMARVTREYGNHYTGVWGDQAHYAEQSRLEVLASLNKLAGIAP